METVSPPDVKWPAQGCRDHEWFSKTWLFRSKYNALSVASYDFNKLLGTNKVWLWDSNSAVRILTWKRGYN